MVLIKSSKYQENVSYFRWHLLAKNNLNDKLIKISNNFSIYNLL